MELGSQRTDDGNAAHRYSIRHSDVISHHPGATLHYRTLIGFDYDTTIVCLDILATSLTARRRGWRWRLPTGIKIPEVL